MYNPPCKNCPERHDLCHSHCERYLAFQKERQQFLKEQMIRNQTKQDLYSLAIERRNSWKRMAKDKQLRKERGEHK